MGIQGAITHLSTGRGPYIHIEAVAKHGFVRAVIDLKRHRLHPGRLDDLLAEHTLLFIDAPAVPQRHVGRG